MELIDKYGRTLDYVRLAITDRCNLRCGYCMPECGIDFVDRKELLSYEEIHRLLGILSTYGVKKIRITGGEPFVRKGAMDFLEKVHREAWFTQTHITTNATLTDQYIARFKNAGIKSVNISLDTLKRDRFLMISRRDELPKVLDSIQQLLTNQIKVKINMVVMAGINDDDISPMAELAKHQMVDVRFLEEMPFNGTGLSKRECFTHIDILNRLKGDYPSMIPQPVEPGETSVRYKVEGFVGSLGIIASYSRTFCGSCNRLRITPTGALKTCLYDDQTLDLRSYLRNGSTDEDIGIAISDAVLNKAKDGHAAEKQRNRLNIHESMAAIGG